MKITDLAKKPELVKITLDDAKIIEEYGEAIEFYTWDRADLHTFLKLGSVNPEDQSALIEVVSELLLNENGEPVLKDGVSLPVGILLGVINEIVSRLGK